jgi:carboxypeptidase D
MGLENFRHKRVGRDVEAGDFDESELDDLHVETPTDDVHRHRYSIGSADDEDGGLNGLANGHDKEKATG